MVILAQENITNWDLGVVRHAPLAEVPIWQTLCHTGMVILENITNWDLGVFQYMCCLLCLLRSPFDRNSYAMRWWYRKTSPAKILVSFIIDVACCTRPRCKKMHSGRPQTERFPTFFWFVVTKPETSYVASCCGLEVKPLGVYPLGPSSSSRGPSKGTPPSWTTLRANWC